MCIYISFVYDQYMTICMVKGEPISNINMASNIQRSRYALCLLASVSINLLLIINLWEGSGGLLKLKGDEELSWSRKAAAEAEAVAAVSCSGHGRAYLDGSVVDGKHVCECNTCYGGPDCSLLSSDCSANADSGDPLFLEPFWMQHAASSAILVSGWHRMSYQFNDNSPISIELQKCILKLHSIARNAITAGRYIVYGVGSTQLLSAAVYALSAGNSTSPAARVVASIPFYSVYKTQTDYFNAVDFKFQGDTSSMKNTSDDLNNVIEFVTSPNNPDGLLKKAVLEGPSVKTINDRAYYWPHFTAIPAPADEDLMIFTISKLTGHAGSRFGWALVKDKEVYERMMMYIQMSEIGMSKDTQLRALQLLKVVLEGDGKEIFEFAFHTMRDRWERLSRTFSTSKRFSIQHIPPLYCTYFQKTRGPSPAYAWVKCERVEDEDCSAVLSAANIIGRGGMRFSADSRYVRLSLIKSQDDFDILLQRINELVSKEYGIIETM